MCLVEKLKGFVNFYVLKTGHFYKGTEISIEKMTPWQKKMKSILQA